MVFLKIKNDKCIHILINKEIKKINKQRKILKNPKFDDLLNNFTYVMFLLIMLIGFKFKKLLLIQYFIMSSEDAIYFMKK